MTISPSASREAICRHYTITKNGRITTPGEFRGQPVYAPYFAERALADYGWFMVCEPAEHVAFPELRGAYGVFVEYVGDDDDHVQVTTYADQAAFEAARSAFDDEEDA